VSENGISPDARRVVRVELHVFAFPMRNVGRSGTELTDLPGEDTNRTRIAVEIETADGARGCYAGGNETMIGQAKIAAKLLLGRDALARESFYDDIKRKLRKNDRMGVGPIDIALWDLAGHRAGMAVAAMLGGFRTRVKAYASTWFGGEEGGLASPGAFADFAEACLAMGYRGFKMHGWVDGNPDREAETLRLLGRRVGGRMALMHDAACHLRTFADALAVGRACDEAGAFWYEDPFNDGGLSAHAHRKLRELIRTPILLGEHVRGLEAVATLVLAGGTDFLRADPDFDMGITGTMKLAHFAEALGLDIELHAPGPAARACMAAIRNTNWYELSLVGPSGGRFTPDCYACGYSDHLETVGADGCFPVPQGPGLGVRMDWDWIRRHRTEHHVFASNAKSGQGAAQ
jgi:L-alanine-DL-glutamate epimerase-like enolase superfamily enzyme